MTPLAQREPFEQVTGATPLPRTLDNRSGSKTMCLELDRSAQAQLVRGHHDAPCGSPMNGSRRRPAHRQRLVDQPPRVDALGGLDASNADAEPRIFFVARCASRLAARQGEATRKKLKELRAEM